MADERDNIEDQPAWEDPIGDVPEQIVAEEADATEEAGADCRWYRTSGWHI